MNKGIAILIAAAGFGLSVLPASAQATRTWVSGVGSDANPCSRTAPCQTFAGASGGVISRCFCRPSYVLATATSVPCDTAIHRPPYLRLRSARCRRTYSTSRSGSYARALMPLVIETVSKSISLVRAALDFGM